MYSDMMDSIGFVSKLDPELGAAMNDELKRQQSNLEMIASENLVSPAVMAAMGSVLTNKYAEGYPGSDIMADANMSTSLKPLHVTALVSFFMPNMPMFSLTLAHRLTLLFILHF